MRYSVSVPVYNTPLGDLAPMVARAEDAGFDRAFVYEVYFDPYLTLATAALATNRIQLGTAIAVAFSRSPFLAANQAADVDELSGGRMLLGLGAGGKEQLETLHGVPLTAPLGRIREYVEVLRLSWAHLATGKPASFEGRFHKVILPEGNPFERHMARETIPIYLAGVRPKMISLAGEIGDGLMGFFYTPAFLKEVVHPNVAEGARRAGRDPSAVDVTSLTICSVSTDRAEASTTP